MHDIWNPWHGWDNVWFNVTCENQQMADKRLQFLQKKCIK